MKARKKNPKKKRTVVEELSGSFPLTIGGETHSVKELSIAESTEFRAAAGPLFEPIAEQVLRMSQSADKNKSVEEYLAALPKGLSKAEREAAAKKAEEKAAEAAALKFLPPMVPWLMSDGLSRLVELPFQYAPELEEFRADATDVELVRAGMEVLRLVFPLFVMVLLELPAMVEGMAEGFG